MGLLVLLVLVVVFLAALGRHAVPRRERVPVWRWGFGDLAANVALGVRAFVALSVRHSERVERARDGWR